VRPWILVVGPFKACGIVLAATHHPGVGALVFFAPDPWLFAQFVLPAAQAFGPAATSFATGRREVWLTIDDGPDPASTPRVLDLLEAHGARATFFVIGEQAAKYPDLARLIAARGHTIGNHTQTHPVGDFWFASPRRIARQIDQCTQALLMAEAPFEHYFRPPVGVRNFFLEAQLAERGMLQVLWSARGLDGSGRDPGAALRRIVPRIKPGGILVSHEGGWRTRERVEFIELLLGHLAREGYSCVLPPRESLRARARPLEPRA
jgi:peptidoglycan/xylan/chitin deacetylase (PgdA/CDA1 family)